MTDKMTDRILIMAQGVCVGVPIMLLPYSVADPIFSTMLASLCAGIWALTAYNMGRRHGLQHGVTEANRVLRGIYDSLQAEQNEAVRRLNEGTVTKSLPRPS